MYTDAPDLELVYEAGVFGARPARLPLSIGDPTIVTGATAATSMWELFAFYLQGGLIDVGFLGAAQIDRFGNINTTVIGDYAHPTTRLPGSGGACEIAINARQVFVIMRQSARSFVETIDFRTSAGNLGGAEQSERIRREQGWLGRGPSVVVDRPRDLPLRRDRRDVPRFSPDPGRHARFEQVRETIGWDVKVASEIAATPPPTADELRLIRDELDPEGAYTRDGASDRGSSAKRLGELDRGGLLESGLEPIRRPAGRPDQHISDDPMRVPDRLAVGATNTSSRGWPLIHQPMRSLTRTAEISVPGLEDLQKSQD